MRQKTLNLEFLTPAFLGDAEQNARWRTPPFKAQLRQFWRMIYAQRKGFKPDLAAMRKEEGHLFGNAWLKDDFQKSRVRLRLSRWSEGSLKAGEWESVGKVHHPEAGKGGMEVAADLYLGYGPVLPSSVRPSKLKSNAAIQADETALLSLAYPDEQADEIESALSLLHLYGTVGGRSRNGWGSYVCIEDGARFPDPAAVPVLDWLDCLAADWPHALGSDSSGPLVWTTAPQSEWKQVMVQLAKIKIQFRTHLKFPEGPQGSKAYDRHWISYPVTNHRVSAWGDTYRLPNSLRFKVRKCPDGRLVGVVFHMPHLPPAAFRPDRKFIAEVWRKVHAKLDTLPELKRTKA